jgi:hypothetical protein
MKNSTESIKQSKHGKEDVKKHNIEIEKDE